MEEDVYEICIFISKSTQSVLTISTKESRIVAAVEVGSEKLRNKTSDNLIDRTKIVSDCPLEENRVIPFSMERIIQSGQDDSYV